MKKFTIILLSVLLVFSLFSCKEEQKPKSEVTSYKRLSLADVETPTLDEIGEEIVYVKEDEKKAFALDAINNVMFFAGTDTVDTLVKFLAENLSDDSEPVADAELSKSVKGSTKLFVRDEDFVTDSGDSVTVNYLDLVSDIDVNSLVGTLKSIKEDITKLDFTTSVEYSSLVESFTAFLVPGGEDVELDFNSSFYVDFDLLEPVEIENDPKDPQVHSNATLDFRASFSSTKVIRTDESIIDPESGKEIATVLGVYNNPITITFDIPVINIDDQAATYIYELQTGTKKMSANNFATAINHDATDIIATVSWLERDGRSIKTNSCDLSIADIINEFFVEHVEPTPEV